MNGYDDLDGFGDQYAPEATGFLPNLEALADGTYDFTILAADVGWSNRRLNCGDRLIRIEILAEQVGLRVEHTYWLTRQEGFNQFGFDCAILGLPSATWGKQVKLSQAIPEACRSIRGRRFKGSKTHNVGTKVGSDGKVKTYHNLFVNARLPDAQAGTLPPQPVDAGAGASDNEIPF